MNGRNEREGDIATKPQYCPETVHSKPKPFLLL